MEMDYSQGFTQGFTQGMQVQREKAYSQGIEQGEKLAAKIGFYIGFCIEISQKCDEKSRLKIQSFLEKLNNFTPNFKTLDDDLLQIDLEFRKIQSNFRKNLKISAPNVLYKSSETW